MGQPAAGQTGASTSISATVTAELLSSAPKRGDAAVAILSCADGSERWAWQRKTVGYPVPSCVGKLCLFGGNREPSDDSARGTLIRELREELPAAWIDEAVSSLAPVARFVISSSDAVMAPRPAYVFTCCVFHAFLPSCATQEDHVSEGSLELLSLDDLHRSAFCWGCAHLKPHASDAHGPCFRHLILSLCRIAVCAQLRPRLRELYCGEGLGVVQRGTVRCAAQCCATDCCGR